MARSACPDIGFFPLQRRVRRLAVTAVPGDWNLLEAISNERLHERMQALNPGLLLSTGLWSRAARRGLTLESAGADGTVWRMDGTCR